MQRLLNISSKNKPIFIFSSVGAIGAANYTELFGVNHVILRDDEFTNYYPYNTFITPFFSTCSYVTEPNPAFQPSWLYGSGWGFERKWFFRPAYIKIIEREKNKIKN